MLFRSHAFFSREGGVSKGIYESLNGGIGSNDNPADVIENRRRMAEHLGVAPAQFLTVFQIHSPDVAIATAPWETDTRPRADAMVTNVPGLALGDERAAPRFIATVPRRGYRFVAALADEEARRPPPPAPVGPAALEPKGVVVGRVLERATIAEEALDAQIVGELRIVVEAARVDVDAFFEMLAGVEKGLRNVDQAGVVVTPPKRVHQLL